MPVAGHERRVRGEVRVGGVDPVDQRQVGAGVGDVDPGRAQAGRHPVDDPADRALGPQHVARVVVAVQERHRPGRLGTPNGVQQRRPRRRRVRPPRDRDPVGIEPGSVAGQPARQVGRVEPGCGLREPPDVEVAHHRCPRDARHQHRRAADRPPQAVRGERLGDDRAEDGPGRLERADLVGHVVRSLPDEIGAVPAAEHQRVWSSASTRVRFEVVPKRSERTARTRLAPVASAIQARAPSSTRAG